MIRGGGTHLAHIGVRGTSQQQRLRTFARGQRIVRVGFQHLVVRGRGTGIIALHRQTMGLFVLRRHRLLRRRGLPGVRIARIRRGAGHTSLLRHLHDLRQHLIHDLLHLLIRRHPLQQRHRPPVDQREQGRRPLDAECLGHGGERGHIDAGKLQLAVHRVHRVAQGLGHREEAIVGRQPQQQQDRERGRGLHHGLERVLRGVDDVPTGRRRASRLPRFGRDLMLQRLQIHRARQGHTRIELPLLTCHRASKLEEPY